MRIVWALRFHSTAQGSFRGAVLGLCQVHLWQAAKNAPADVAMSIANGLTTRRQAALSERTCNLPHMELDLFAQPNDPALEEVAAELIKLDPDGSRFGEVVRHTYDMIYNGAETGRYRFDQLMKTEKTHFGTVFEINVQREFGFDGGDKTDYRIAGHEVDAKWSMKDGGWMLPPEVFGELALVATGSDPDSTFSIGLIRIRPAYRREGANRDKKSSLNPVGRAAIRWIWRDEPFPPSVLLQLPRTTVDDIFALKFGTKRVDALFRAAEGMLVHRNAVRTVAMQLDDQKRVRYNGGARSSLQPEGFLILSGAYHRGLASALGLPAPSKVQYVSVRVVPATSTEGVLIWGTLWRRRTADDTENSSAPAL